MCPNTNKRIIQITFPGMPTQEGSFPLVLWAKGRCTLLSLPRPSQHFQHLSVRLITRETEKKLGLAQKFKPKSESLIPSFLFLMQRGDKAGCKAYVCISFGIKAHSSARRGHVLKFPLDGKPAVERAGGCGAAGWAPLGQCGQAQLQTLQLHGQSPLVLARRVKWKRSVH